MDNFQYIKDRARCPICRQSALQWQRQTGSCSTCDALFHPSNGIPVLLNATGTALIKDELGTSTGKDMVSEYHTQPQKQSSAKSTLVKLLTPPDIFYYPNPDLKDPKTNSIFDHAGADTSILNVGGGPKRYANEISLNLQPFVNVNIVGDAHEIPFQNESFDSIICNAVLEHVTNPQLVVNEMLRVLKPGGLIYIEVPFLFFYHGYPNDYLRFTQHGLQSLLQGVEIVQSGITQGPMSALLLSANRMLELLLPFSSRMPLKLANGLFRWLFFPLKYIDKWLINKPESHVLAGGFFVLGCKH